MMLQRGVQNRVCQRRDVIEAWDFLFFQRHDVRTSRCCDPTLQRDREGKIKKNFKIF